MSRSEQTIEAEVVEIDGVSVSSKPRATATSQSEWKQWSAWRGHLGKLDARWWPLWAVLGFTALVLAVAVGLCAAAVLVSYKILKSLVIGVLSLFIPGQEPHRR